MNEVFLNLQTDDSKTAQSEGMSLEVVENLVSSGSSTRNDEDS